MSVQIYTYIIKHNNQELSQHFSYKILSLHECIEILKSVHKMPEEILNSTVAIDRTPNSLSITGFNNENWSMQLQHPTCIRLTELLSYLKRKHIKHGDIKVYIGIDYGTDMYPMKWDDIAVKKENGEDYLVIGLEVEDE